MRYETNLSYCNSNKTHKSNSSSFEHYLGVKKSFYNIMKHVLVHTAHFGDLNIFPLKSFAVTWFHEKVWNGCKIHLILLTLWKNVKFTVTRNISSNQLHAFNSKNVVFTKFFLHWKNEKFGLTEKIFRQIKSIVICLVKTLLSRNFCQKSVRPKFYNFHTVWHTLWSLRKSYITVFWKISVKTTYFSNLKSFTVRLISRNNS